MKKDGPNLQYSYSSLLFSSRRREKRSVSAFARSRNTYHDAVGDLLYATDGQHSYSYAYDALNRPIYTTFNFDSQSAVFTYTYDLAGRRTSSSLSLNGHSDRVNQTTYDFLGNATSIRQTGSAVDEIFAEFDYNANGLMTSVKRYEVDGNNLINEIAESVYTYNANNAVTSITHKNLNGTQIVQHSYTYDETNNIVEYLNSIDGQTSYDYDFLGQLIGADYANQNLDDEAYTYDENGNRITANGNTYTTGDNNELTSDGTCSYTYDAEGNRISKSNSTNRELYTWDHRNRLTTVTQQEWDSVEQEWTTTQIVEFAYDYNNVWIRKVIGTDKTIFIPENYQTTVQIDNGTTTHHYLWTPNTQDKLLADTTPNSTSWALTDHLGTNPLLFGYTGKAFDTATQLQNNINRWYDASSGRWLCTDPIGFEGNDTNLYRYVCNNSVWFIDSLGNKKSLKDRIPYCKLAEKCNKSANEILEELNRIENAINKVWVFPVWTQRCEAWVREFEKFYGLPTVGIVTTYSTPCQEAVGIKTWWGTPAHCWVEFGLCDGTHLHYFNGG